jgi:choline dehydrogenase
VIGGCSAHNAAFVVWGDGRDYDEWGVPERSFDAFEPYLRDAERTIRTRRLSDEELGPWARAVREAAPEAGFPVLDDFNDLSRPVGAAYLPVNVDRFARWNTAFAYLDAARGRDNLTVIGAALVDRVLLDGRRARGTVALVAGEPVELLAELVIVCAGVFGSPAVLMRSGMLGIATVLDRPGVGANLQDHYGVNMVFRAGAELERELNGRTRAGARSATARPSGRPAERARSTRGTFTS